ncbi:MAG: hypothetical protein ACXACG_12480 [Candidatus Thorarchaeota archaeon]|jgi:hypothetical protein
MDEYERPIRKLAETLSRRGQTIYGRRAIVELCSKTGVSLMNILDIGDSDSDEALQDFLVQYSKLSPAAKLTILILSKQYGVSLPEELFGKKKGLKDRLESLQDYLPWSP